MKHEPLYYPGSIDSHAHLALLESKGLDAQAVIASASRAGMRRIIDVGIEPSDLASRLHLYGDARLLAFTAGLHPTAVRPDDCEHQLTVLEHALAREPVVAVGEAGLDFYHSDEYRTLQLQALERQAGLARGHGLPLILHNRSSEAEMLDFLRRTRPSGVMHCFSQGPDYCRACLDLGMYISFGGNTTYRSAADLRAAAAIVPDDRLLAETDSPFLSPQPVRGRPNESGHLGYLIDELARIRNDRPERIAELTAANACRLFSLIL